ncbi:hypothetical protein TNIN_90441, partial [Trichonephila inaurata madagascariensis]
VDLDQLLMVRLKPSQRQCHLEEFSRIVILSDLKAVVTRVHGLALLEPHTQ